MLEEEEQFMTQHPGEGADAAPVLGGRGSLTALLVVQAMNSFSDNFVKMLLIVFASAVAAHTFLGDRMQACVGVVFSLPYIFLAPLAGWLSDRFSKQRVVLAMQISQVFIFMIFGAALLLRHPVTSLVLCLVGMLFLATEAAIFAPAKLGILKELTGPRRLGLISGVQQFSMFGAILFSYWLAGDWFGKRLEQGADPWKSAQIALACVIGLAVLQSLGALLVHRTPSHHEVHWRRELMLEHFENLRLLFKVRVIGLAALGVVFFWFMSNAVGAILVGLCNEQYPIASESAQMKGWLSAMLGVGLMSGILSATLLSAKRIELRIVPTAAMIMAGAMFWIWLMPPHSKAISWAMVAAGFGAGAFMVPLYAFLQDRSAERERARILAGVGLIDCLGSAVANLLVIGLIGRVSSVLQLAGMGVLSVLAAIGMLKLVRDGHKPTAQ
jgi:acyl-[acyl-carrier-protein]-phospholipid O-acyltransferase/long-chain-fatty-acid--[acyl-carrier-protein] ligase